MLGLRMMLVLALGLAVRAASKSLPHLVFVMADDLGWANVGYHNSHVRKQTNKCWIP